MQRIARVRHACTRSMPSYFFAIIFNKTKLAERKVRIDMWIAVTSGVDTGASRVQWTWASELHWLSRKTQATLKISANRLKPTERTSQWYTSDFVPDAAPWWVTFSIRPIDVAFACWLWANMTSSTKPEVYNVLHLRQRRAEPPRQIVDTESSNVWFLSCASGETDRQTYRHADRNTSHPYRDKVKKKYANSEDWCNFIYVRLRPLEFYLLNLNGVRSPRYFWLSSLRCSKHRYYLYAKNVTAQ